MRNFQLFAFLSAAKTPQEFVALMGQADKEMWLSGPELGTLLTVRDALGAVMNKSTPTWIPNRLDEETERRAEG